MADRSALHREAARKIVDIRQFRRSQIAIGVATVLGLVALVIGIVLLFTINDRQDQGITQLTGSLATVCERADTAQVPGQVAQDCERAKEGLPPLVVEGVDGTDGVDGLPGVGGAQGVAGFPGPPGQLGTPGAPGTPGAAGTSGTDGADGADGVDGQSPPCLDTPAMCQGRDGVDGSNGRDGTPAMTQVQTYPDGSEITCTRTGRPDTAPTYSCSQTRAPSTTTDPGPTAPGENEVPR